MTTDRSENLNSQTDSSRTREVDKDLDKIFGEKRIKEVIYDFAWDKCEWCQKKIYFDTGETWEVPICSMLKCIEFSVCSAECGAVAQEDYEESWESERDDWLDAMKYRRRSMREARIRHNQN